MKQPNRKKFASTLVFGLAVLLSSQVNAQQPTIQSAVKALVASQGKAVMNELTNQLSQSIENKVNQFSIEQPAAWFTEVKQKSTPTAHVSNHKQITSADE